MSAATHEMKSYTIKLKLEACEYVHTPKNLMWQVSDVLIEAGSPIKARGVQGICSNRSRGLVLEVLW